jgi:CRP-like cAMP-binding protein
VTYRNQVLAALSPPQASRLQPHLVECAFDAGTVLYQPGDPINAVYFPSTAVVSVVTLMRNGRSVESATLGKESLIGAVAALADVPAHSQFVVQVSGKCWRLPTPHLKAFVHGDPSAMKLVLAYVQRDIVLAQQSIACNALHNVSQRVAKWLLVAQDRANSSILPMTQEHISLMMGVQRNSVTVAATSFKRDRLIKYARGRIEIVNRLGLIRAACECYSTESELPTVEQLEENRPVSARMGN